MIWYHTTKLFRLPIKHDHLDTYCMINRFWGMLTLTTLDILCKCSCNSLSAANSGGNAELYLIGMTLIWQIMRYFLCMRKYDFESDALRPMISNKLFYYSYGDTPQTLGNEYITYDCSMSLRLVGRFGEIIFILFQLRCFWKCRLIRRRRRRRQLYRNSKAQSQKRCSNPFPFLTWSLLFGINLTTYHKKDSVESLWK